VDSIHLAQDRDQLGALLNIVMNLRVPLKAAERLLASEGGLYSIDGVSHVYINTEYCPKNESRHMYC